MRDQFTPEGDIVLDNALSYWIARVYLANRGEMYRRFRQHGVEMTPEQWMVLVRLWEEEGLTQTQLAARTWRDLPTMSRILAVMEREELIVRQPDPQDSRARRVFPAARAKQLRRTLTREARAMVHCLTEGIAEEDLLITRRTLQRMLENLEAQD